jgi:hypothetical protein
MANKSVQKEHELTNIISIELVNSHSYRCRRCSEDPREGLAEESPFTGMEVVY